jgi:hypothetical protein
MAPTNIRLRLEAQSGSDIEEYRVYHGRVEVRSGRSVGPDELSETGWGQLTPQQLRTHVERNTVVAQWLERRLGWRPLLQACVSHEPLGWRTVPDRVEQDAA